MADTIYEHYTTQFASNWINRCQQKISRLARYVTPAPFVGERKRYSRTAAMSMTQIVTRKGDTPITDAVDDLRWIYMKGYEIGTDLDQFDAQLLGELVLPTSTRIQQFAYAANRTKDAAIIEAATGAVMTGELGTTSTAFPTSTNQIAVNYVETGSPADSNLTLGKLRKARQLMQDAEIDIDGMDGTEEMPVFVLGGSQIQSLLASTTVTSAEYNTVRALVDGKIDTFLGFRFVRCAGALGYDGSSHIRTCVAFLPSAVLFNDGPKTTTIDRIPEKQNKIQIYGTALFGGMRLHDEGVVTVLCDEDVVA